MSSSIASRVSRLTLTAALVLQACGGGGDKCPVSAPNCGANPGGNTPTVVSVTLSGAPGTLSIGQTASLTATVAVTNGASQAVNWSSSNTSVASVNANGNS